jgi:predicted nuclease of predicted toxin-antitoxin system
VSRPRFLGDNDLVDAIIRSIRREEPSIEFVRAREAGLEDRSDDELLAYAAREGFITVSHDVNTMISAALERVAADLPMMGLAMVPQRRVRKQVIADLILIWAASEAEEWRNRIDFLPL